jgi:hypothetical protein
MLECEAHHYLDGPATPLRGGGGTKRLGSHSGGPSFMVDPIANGADIEVPVLTVAKADQIAPATPGRRPAGLAKLANLPATS